MSRTREKADLLSVPEAYGDWRKMLKNASLDAVAIAAPPKVQYDVARDALRAGLPVFTEKPVAVTEEEARILRDQAHASGVANVVDFLFPELELWRQAKELLTDGRLGAVGHVSVNWCVESHDNRLGLVGWKTDNAQGGGALLHYGCHILYYLEDYLGPIVALSARIGAPPWYARPADTISTLALDFASGALGSVVLSTSATFAAHHRVEFYCERGTLVLTNRTTDPVDGFKLFLGRTGDDQLGEVTVTPAGERTSAEDSRVAPTSRIVSRFLDWIETGEPTTPSLEEGRRVQFLLEAASRSDREGRRIDVLEAR